RGRLVGIATLLRPLSQPFDIVACVQALAGRTWLRLRANIAATDVRVERRSTHLQHMRRVCGADPVAAIVIALAAGSMMILGVRIVARCHLRPGGLLASHMAEISNNTLIIY